MPRTDAQHRSESTARLTAEARSALLKECYALWKPKLDDLVRMSIGHTNDLFEFVDIPEQEVGDFFRKRGEWLANFEQVYPALYARRLRGERRRGRRPDADAAYDPTRDMDELALLSSDDHRTQTVLVRASRMLQHVTKKETLALDLRMEVLLGSEPGKEVDNPFGVPHVLDAVGFTSRAVYPNPKVWRPLMQRILGDLTWSIKNAYVALNRLLADRGVLPEIMAVLRARSQHRPHDDRELFSRFSQMMEAAGLTAANDVAALCVPPETGTRRIVDFGPTSPPPEVEVPAADLMDQARVAPNPMVTPSILAGIAALAKPEARPANVPLDPDEFPELMPTLAFGSSSSLFASLGQLQRHDLAAAMRAAIGAGEGEAAPALPLNLIPYIRAANADQIANPTDRIVMDVVGLLFDYIFRDPSIPPPLRELFARLQVPILKAALLDRAFFSDSQHPARALLDHLAEAAVGADPAHDHGHAFHALATEVVGSLCRDFETDVRAITLADRRVVEFMDAERARLSEVLSLHIAQAEADEAAEADRAEIRTIVRERLAGLDVPFIVHSFVETFWTKYLVTLRREQGPEGVGYREALETVGKLLWSIVAKERTMQKMRLAKLIPGLVAALRQGIATVPVPTDQAQAFLEALYALHVAAIKPRAPLPDAVLAANDAVVSNMVDVHDFVNEIVLGSWITFRIDGESLTTRLAWISPTRGKFIFVRHSPAHVISLDAEALAYELGTGRATLVLETVPLFDRAVSAALDQLAAKAPPPGSAMAKLSMALTAASPSPRVSR